MSASDHAAFQMAIAADPADLTARLVYADFLDETGDPAHAARAEFIRTQVEADRLPPNDPRRADLEQRGRDLFDRHWVEWWAPVCELVGLPAPAPRWGGPPAGRPYAAAAHLCWVHRSRSDPRENRMLDALETVEFRRGWPEGLDLTGELDAWRWPVRRWAAVLPLRGLGLRVSLPRDWAAVRGEHLRHVARLTLTECHTEVVRETLASPHLTRLADLTLHSDTSRAGWGLEQLRVVVASPAAPLLERFTVVLTHPDEARAFARSDRFARLKELAVSTDKLRPYGEEQTAAAIHRLAGAGCLAQLTSLTLKFGRSVEGEHRSLHPAVEGAVLRLLEGLSPDRLRSLNLDGTQLMNPRVAARVAARFGEHVMW